MFLAACPPMCVARIKLRKQTNENTSNQQNNSKPDLTNNTATQHQQLTAKQQTQHAQQTEPWKKKLEQYRSALSVRSLSYSAAILSTLPATTQQQHSNNNRENNTVSSNNKVLSHFSTGDWLRAPSIRNMLLVIPPRRQSQDIVFIDVGGILGY